MFTMDRIKTLAASALTLLLVGIVPRVHAETISLEFGCTLNNAIRSAQTDTSVGGCRSR